MFDRGCFRLGDRTHLFRSEQPSWEPDNTFWNLRVHSRICAVDAPGHTGAPPPPPKKKGDDFHAKDDDVYEVAHKSSGKENLWLEKKQPGSVFIIVYKAEVALPAPLPSRPAHTSLDPPPPHL
uniref:Uncharacterized protein n=1 Tax=Sphaerodactylus townsendi TaxID=933632 RepID=A0ACB8FGI0_9SAUR